MGLLTMIYDWFGHKEGELQPSEKKKIEKENVNNAIREMQGSISTRQEDVRRRMDMLAKEVEVMTESHSLKPRKTT